MRVHARRPAILPAALFPLLACGNTHRSDAQGPPTTPAPLHAAHPGLRAPDDLVLRGVRGARLFPERLEEAHGWGEEPGGGVRTLVAGLRFVLQADGAMVSADDRLPATPSSVVGLPDRLGGGFLFALKAHLWRSQTWLGPALSFATAPAPVAQLLVGLDRVYARSATGGLVALDPRSGAGMGLGPLPASPTVARIAAFDAWHAVAIADMRGAVLTRDAGATWLPLALPIDPAELVPLADSIAIGGLDENGQLAWWEVRADGVSGRLSPPAGSRTGGDPLPAPADATARAFGPRPLVAAVEDGWPLVDGTALVARDGAIARIRLTDGVVVETVAHAFPLKPSRCHPLSLARPADPGAFGFSCGEPRGRTLVYRWDADPGGLVELARFDRPREALAFGNGALAVRGPCDPQGEAELTGDEPQLWCVKPPTSAWREARSQPGDRIVVLSDGRIARIRPPRGGGLASARLLLGDGEATSERPLVLPPLSAEVAHALSLGVWMDGFEERRKGVVGGWVDAAGALVGIEVSLDGELRVGEYIRDAGGPVASGRWAFGWTASRRGFETTDGGMTWTKEIPLPDPIASGRGVHERVCGPVGCIAAGWLRIGWGPAEQRPVLDPPSPPPPPAPVAPGLDLECELVSRPSLASRSPGEPAGRDRSSSSPGGGNGASGASSTLPPFEGHAPPLMPADDLGYAVEASNGLERTLRGVPLAQIYAWGPKSGEWDPLGRWQVRWQWPWGGVRDVRSSGATPSPWTTLDSARRALTRVPGASTSWALAQGDDADHALLLATHATTPTTVEVVLLDADRPALRVRRADGEPFHDLEAATRLGGRWFLVTVPVPGERQSSVVWTIDGAIAREVTRVPRVGLDSRPPVRLARHSDGRTLGLVVDGQPNAPGGAAMRWVAALDVGSHAIDSPEPLAPVDFSDRKMAVCTGEETGWRLDLPYPGPLRVRAGAKGESGGLEAVTAKVCLSRDHACLERLVGSLEGFASEAPEWLARAAPGADAPPGVSDRGHSLEATVLSAGSRYELLCVSR